VAAAPVRDDQGMRLRWHGGFDAFALVVSVTLTVSSCSGSSSDPGAGARLVVRSSGSIKDSLPHTEPNRSYVFILSTMCSSGGAITIDHVVAAHPTGGMTVTSWGVGGEAAGFAVPLYGPVSRIRGFGHQPVSARCDKSQSDQFAIAVSRTASDRGSMGGVTISYGEGSRVVSRDRIVTVSAQRAP
jgi:hypothetical protein